MAKDRSGKQIRHLKAEIKRLQAEIKRLKREPLDKDEDLDIQSFLDSYGKPCEHCRSGVMSQIDIIGKTYWRCLECGRTKKV